MVQVNVPPFAPSNLLWVFLLVAQVARVKDMEMGFVIGTDPWPIRDVSGNVLSLEV